MELNELTLDNLIKQPLRIRIAVLILIFIAILFLIYTLLLKPRWSQLNILKKQQQDLKNTYQIQQAKISKLPLYEKEFRQIEIIDRKILTQLVNKNEFSDVLKTISHLSAQNNVELSALKPEPEIKQAPYIAMPIRMDLNGDFLNLIRFLNKMTELPKLIIFQEMFFTSTANTHRVFLKMKAVVYRDSGEKVISRTTPINIVGAPREAPITNMQNRPFQRDPFSLSQAILNSDKNDFSNYPLTALRMVGTVEYLHQRWALIATEDNLVFRVTIGMPVGELESRVVAIDEHQLKIMQALSNGAKQSVTLSLREN